jgi:(R,R)-butanediol dehydrogenase/meso-butanediol dehydrogenase/diacetyl reductase
VRAAGADPVIVTDLSTTRRRSASALGATAVLDPAADRPVRAVRDLTGGGVDVVFDTTGSDRALAEGVGALRPHGTLVNVAGWQEPAHLDMGRLMTKEIDVRFTMTYEPAVDFPVALRLLDARVVDPAVLISDTIPLEAVVAEGLEELLHHADGHVKILVDPTR